MYITLANKCKKNYCKKAQHRASLDKQPQHSKQQKRKEKDNTKKRIQIYSPGIVHLTGPATVCHHILAPDSSALRMTRWLQIREKLIETLITRAHRSLLLRDLLSDPFQPLFILLFRVPLRLRHRVDWRKHLPKSETENKTNQPWETLTAKYSGKLFANVLRHHKNGFTLVRFFLRSPPPQQCFHVGALLLAFSVTTRMVSRWCASSCVLRHHKNGFTLVRFFLRSPPPQQCFQVGTLLLAFSANVTIPSRLVIGTLLGFSATIILLFHISTPSLCVASVGTAWKLSGWTRIVQWWCRHILSQAPHVGLSRLEFRGNFYGISHCLSVT